MAIADVSTAALADAVYSANLYYDLEGSLEKARNFIAACRSKIRFAAEGQKNSQSFKFNLDPIQEQLNAALAWLAANGGSPADETQSADCVFADFSVYAGRGR